MINEKLEKLNQEIAKGEARLRRAQHEEKILEHQVKANDEHYLRRWFYVWIDCFEFHHTLCYGFCRIYLKEAPGKRYDIR